VTELLFCFQLENHSDIPTGNTKKLDTAEPPARSRLDLVRRLPSGWKAAATTSLVCPQRLARAAVDRPHAKGAVPTAGRKRPAVGAVGG
jgi:hypothetical protein